MILENFTSVVDAKSCEDLQSMVFRFTQWLGFERFNATVVQDAPLGATRFAWVENTPAAFAPIATDVQYAQGDPVAQHCKNFGTPIVWNQSTYVARGLGPRWETQAAFGYRTGIALALHLPKGLHFFIGLDREEPLAVDRSEVSRLTASLHLFAAYAQDAGFRCLLPLLRPDDNVRDLTSRELECLRWTMEGKTAWEVGKILSISEQTVVRHVNSATHKLGCVNKHHAVVKALRFGLIQ